MRKEAKQIKTKTNTKRTSKKLEGFSGVKILNIPEKDHGAIIHVRCSGDLNSSSYGKKANYQIKITDCERQILLHGSLNNPLSRKNALHKIDSIIGTLSAFRNHIEESIKNHGLKISK